MTRLRTDAVRTTAGNLLAVGITGLLTLGLPRFLDGQEYGEWQMYQFFCLYLGYMTFGVTDGVFVRAAGAAESRLRSLFLGSQLRTFAVLLALVLALGSGLFVALSTSRVLAIAFVIASVASWLFCLRTFVTVLWQARRMTAPFAMVVVLERAVAFVLAAVLLLAGIDEVIPLVLCDLAGKVVALAWCLLQVTDIPFERAAVVSRGMREFVASCRVGTPLLVANLAAASIYGVVRLFVQHGWGLVVFGRISLALTLANMALVAINSFSVVLVPALKERLDLVEPLQRVRSALLLPIVLALLVYFPLAALVRLVVPEPDLAVRALAVLFPLCAFEVKMRLIGGSFLRAVDRGGLLMTISVGTTLISVPLFAAVLQWHDLDALLLSFVALLAARSLAIEIATTRSVGGNIGRTWALEIVAVSAFLLAVLLFPWTTALITYMAVAAGLVLVHRNQCNNVNTVPR